MSPPSSTAEARRFAPAALIAALLGCGAGESASPPLPWAAVPFPAAPEPADNPTTDAKVELGRLLFYDPVLSRDCQVACATCHSEIWGLSDGLPLSVGVDGVGPTGPGRDGPHKTDRNAQSLWNVAYRATLFWDGRSASLEEQALLPIVSAVELDRDPAVVVAQLAGIKGYRARFGEAFPGEEEPVSETNLARALAAFQRTFVSSWAPYDRYVAGDEGALRPAALAGMFLFAEAGCDGCHTPPLFTSARFANRRVGGDPGRGEITGEPADVGAFAVPTLRNLRETGPYFHDGSAATLEEAVAHEVEVAMGEGASRPLEADEIAAIVSFLNKALMDRSREPDRPDEVPSGLAVPRDGFRIPR